MPSLDLSGRSYFYQDVGTGVPVLLFHGFPFSSDSFWPQLEAPPEGVRLLVPDHRGFGLSAPAAGVATMEAMAQDGLELLDALGIQRALVGGVSMGGYVSIALTRLDASRVRGLLLVDTQSQPDDAEGRARREAAARDAEAHGVEGLVAALLPRLLAPTTATEVRARLEKMMRAQSPQAVAAAARGMATRTDGRDVLSRFSGPCAIVVGANDVITPPEKAEAMHALIEGSTLYIVEGAGHLTNLERPDEFSGIVARLASRCA